MATVYLVSSGADEDYSVARIFTTRAKAAAWIGPGVEQYEITKFGLDDEGDERPTLVYMAFVNLESGDEIGEYRALTSRVILKPTSFLREARRVGDYDGRRHDKWNVFAQSSVSREDAIEAAHDERRNWLAELSPAQASGA